MGFLLKTLLGHSTIVPKTPLRIPHSLSLTICGKFNQSHCVQRSNALLPCTSQDRTSFYFQHSPFSLVIKYVPSGGAYDPGTSLFKPFAPQASHHISSLDLGLCQWDFAPRLSFLGLLSSLMDWSWTSEFQELSSSFQVINRTRELAPRPSVDEHPFRTYLLFQWDSATRSSLLSILHNLWIEPEPVSFRSFPHQLYQGSRSKTVGWRASFFVLIDWTWSKGYQEPFFSVPTSSLARESLLWSSLLIHSSRFWSWILRPPSHNFLSLNFSFDHNQNAINNQSKDFSGSRFLVFFIGSFSSFVRRLRTAFESFFLSIRNPGRDTHLSFRGTRKGWLAEQGELYSIILVLLRRSSKTGRAIQEVHHFSLSTAKFLSFYGILAGQGELPYDIVVRSNRAMFHLRHLCDQSSAVLLFYFFLRWCSTIRRLFSMVHLCHLLWWAASYPFPNHFQVFFR